MKSPASCVASLALGLTMIGCSAEVETTDDSHKLELEVPKVEVGDEALDANPSTDDDLDVDTPSPGDS